MNIKNLVSVDTIKITFETCPILLSFMTNVLTFLKAKFRL